MIQALALLLLAIGLLIYLPAWLLAQALGALYDRFKHWLE